MLWSGQGNIRWHDITLVLRPALPNSWSQINLMYWPHLTLYPTVSALQTYWWKPGWETEIFGTFWNRKISIKQPSLNWEATLGPANLAHVYPISSFKFSQPQYNGSLSRSKTFQESPFFTLVVETWEYVILSPSLTMVTYFYVILKYLNSQFDTWLNLDTFDQGNKHVLVMSISKWLGNLSPKIRHQSVM